MSNFCSGKLKVDTKRGYVDNYMFYIYNYIVMYTMKGCVFMTMHYNTDLKKKLCEDICLKHASTIKTAKEFNVPLKTLEKWITAFNKDNHCFDPKVELINDFKIISEPNNTNYDDLSFDELKKQLMKKDIEIARLKKGYLVKEDLLTVVKSF